MTDSPKTEIHPSDLSYTQGANYARINQNLSDQGARRMATLAEDPDAWLDGYWNTVHNTQS